MIIQKKVRFKLYKSGKRWLVAGVVFLGAGMSVLGAGHAVSADDDTNVQPVNTEAMPVKQATTVVLTQANSANVAGGTEKAVSAGSDTNAKPVVAQTAPKAGTNDGVAPQVSSTNTAGGPVASGQFASGNEQLSNDSDSKPVSSTPTNVISSPTKFDDSVVKADANAAKADVAQSSGTSATEATPAHDPLKSYTFNFYDEEEENTLLGTYVGDSQTSYGYRSGDIKDSSNHVTDDTNYLVDTRNFAAQGLDYGHHGIDYANSPYGDGIISAGLYGDVTAINFDRVIAHGGSLNGLGSTEFPSEAGNIYSVLLVHKKTTELVNTSREVNYAYADGTEAAVSQTQPLQWLKATDMVTNAVTYTPATSTSYPELVSPTIKDYTANLTQVPDVAATDTTGAPVNGTPVTVIYTQTTFTPTNPGTTPATDKAALSKTVTETVVYQTPVNESAQLQQVTLYRTATGDFSKVNADGTLPDAAISYTPWTSDPNGDATKGSSIVTFAPLTQAQEKTPAGNGVVVATTNNDTAVGANVEVKIDESHVTDNNNVTIKRVVSYAQGQLAPGIHVEETATTGDPVSTYGKGELAPGIHVEETGTTGDPVSTYGQGELAPGIHVEETGTTGDPVSTYGQGELAPGIHVEETGRTGDPVSTYGQGELAPGIHVEETATTDEPVSTYGHGELAPGIHVWTKTSVGEPVSSDGTPTQAGNDVPPVTTNTSETNPGGTTNTTSIVPAEPSLPNTFGPTANTTTSTDTNNQKPGSPVELPSTGGTLAGNSDNGVLVASRGSKQNSIRTSAKFKSASDVSENNLPQTGDKSSPLLTVIGLLLMSGIGLFGLAIRKRD